MDEKVVRIENINCEHCVRSIESELSELPGVLQVEASAETREVRVQWAEPANWHEIKSLLLGINYPPTDS